MNDLQSVLYYIQSLKQGSFVGWTYDEERSYLTALISVEEYIKSLPTLKRITNVTK